MARVDHRSIALAYNVIALSLTPELELHEAENGAFLLIESGLFFACPSGLAVVNPARRDSPSSWPCRAFILTPARSACIEDKADNAKKAEAFNPFVHIRNRMGPLGGMISSNSCTLNR